jgi:hypothetical protein
MIRIAETPFTTQAENARHAYRTQPRHAQKFVPVGTVQFDREAFRVRQRPRQFRVEVQRQVAIRVIREFLLLETVAPQQPVCFTETLLAHKRRRRTTPKRCAGHRSERAKIDPTQRQVAVEPGGRHQQVAVALSGCTHDELRRSPALIAPVRLQSRASASGAIRSRNQSRSGEIRARYAAVGASRLRLIRSARRAARSISATGAPGSSFR